MRFKVFYIIFFICAFLFGAVMVGPLSLRNIATLIMFVVCVKHEALRIDKYFSIYLIYITFYVLSCWNSGYLQEAITKCVAYYFVCFVGYQATKVLIRKYDGLKWLVYTLLFLGVLDAGLTLMQSFGISSAFVPYEMIRPKEVSEDLLSFYDKTGSMNGVVLPGIVGGVPNGYLLSALCALAFYRIRDKLSVINYVLLGLYFLALIAVQERSGLLVGTALIIYIVIRGVGHTNKLIPILLFGSICFFAYPYLSDLIFHENSRFTDLSFENDVRSDYYDYVREFIQENPFGGIYDYQKIYVLPPHNLFLNALVYAGIFGFPFFIGLLIMQIKTIIPILKRRISMNNMPLILFTLMYIADTTNSLVHNASLITGNLSSWVYWGVVVAYREKCNQYTL